MSGLREFLMENSVDNLTEKVVVSARLAQYPFTIRAMTGPEFADYQKMATKVGRHNKVEFNRKLFNELVVLNQTVEPNFRDASLIKDCGCQNPEQLLYKKLLAGEIAELAQQISTLSGFDTDMEEAVKDAKNL